MKGSQMDGMPGTCDQPQQQQHLSMPATAQRHASSIDSTAPASIDSTSSTSTSTSTSESTAVVPVKKRKLRKGTFSCIECKRRKVKCFFANGSTDGQGTCVSCQRHSTPCIGQEYAAPSSPLASGAGAAADDSRRQCKYSDVGRRIREVEALVNELLCRRIINGFPASCDSGDGDGDGDGDGYGCGYDYEYVDNDDDNAATVTTTRHDV